VYKRHLQVLINILNNAKDELFKKEIERYIFIDGYKEKENYIIKIKDNAGGIGEEIIDRIFEPYFTTKHKSKGTGIGLYMCQEIMSKHIGGTIRVFNEKYEYKNQEFSGAKFEIIIPL
jgi:C4-dicarboxylate-specific signal transduction histidine kinase